MKKSHPPSDRRAPGVDNIELEGPTEFTLALPRRRSSAVVFLAVAVVSALALAGALLVRPEVVSVVQAFSLGLRP